MKEVAKENQEKMGKFGLKQKNSFLSNEILITIGNNKNKRMSWKFIRFFIFWGMTEQISLILLVTASTFHG